jgi:putative hydrolase of the HAD superfamily
MVMGEMKAIFFDLDNTLIDFMQMKRAACEAAAQAMVNAGLKMNQQEVYQKIMDTYFEVGLESDRAFTEFLKKENQFNHKTLAAAINAYLKTKSDFVKPYKDVKIVLQKLADKGFTLAIVTDAPKTKAYQRLLIMDIESYFTFVLGFEDTQAIKKTGLPLKRALKEVRKKLPNIRESEILFVGDSIERDMGPAKQAGFKTALAKYGQQKETTETEKGIVDYELIEFSDLTKII